MDNNRGFTLIEVLLSIVILGVIITCFSQFFIFSQETTTNNQDKLVAINIAQKVLEQIKEDAQSNGTSSSSPYWVISHPPEAGNYQQEYGPFLERIDEIQYKVMVGVGHELENGLRMITITVFMRGDERKLSSVKGLVKL